MNPLIILCLIVIAACCAIPARNNGDTNKIEKDVTGYFVHKRAKRTIIGKIIQGTRLLWSQTDFRMLTKKGGLQEAIEDFRRLDPTDVRVFGGSREGRLGDKTVVVISNPLLNTATMDIWKYAKVANGGSYITRTDRIKYNQ